MKSGNTLEGVKAVTSHTGKLINDDMSFDLIFKKAGILRFYDEQALVKGKQDFVDATGTKSTTANEVVITFTKVFW